MDKEPPKNANNASVCKLVMETGPTIPTGATTPFPSIIAESKGPGAIPPNQLVPVVQIVSPNPVHSKTVPVLVPRVYCREF